MNKQSKSTVVLIIIFLAGLGLLLYPSVSDYWNSFHSSRAIADYTEQVAQLDYAQYEQLWTAAQRFNQQLAQRPFLLMLSDEEKEAYNRQLNVSGSGMMGSIEIPSIKCTLPIYHGTDEAVLQAAVGHLEGTSLPVGGSSTHCVLSGHRALPSARLFTDLDKLVEGDLFLLHILDETLTYEVDQILIVEPGEVAALAIEPGQDYCTLVTCTPYGINTHRMLVRGHRVENQSDGSVRVAADALQIEPLLVAPLVAVPILLLLLFGLLLHDRKKK